MKKENIFNDFAFVSACVFFLAAAGLTLMKNSPELKEINKEELKEYIASELNLNNNIEMLDQHIAENIVKEEETTKIVAPPVVEKILTDDMQSKAYNIGYKSGQRAMYTQMNMQVNEEEKTTEYTSIEENNLIEEEKKKIDEIIQKGYVDGYHHASESMSCPRSY